MIMTKKELLQKTKEPFRYSKIAISTLLTLIPGHATLAEGELADERKTLGRVRGGRLGEER